MLSVRVPVNEPTKLSEIPMDGQGLLLSIPDAARSRRRPATSLARTLVCDQDLQKLLTAALSVNASSAKATTAARVQARHAGRNLTHGLSNYQHWVSNICTSISHHT
jgi:hypothetical protein